MGGSSLTLAGGSGECSRVSEDGLLAGSGCLARVLVGTPSSKHTSPLRSGSRSGEV